MTVRERTETAIQSPLSPNERPDVAVLLMVGSAETPGLPPNRRLIIVRDRVTLGRQPPPDDAPGALAAVLPDGLVSSQHARLERGGPGAGIDLVDLDSKNGTFVDAVRVQGRTRLRDGALVFIGAHVGVFRMVSALELEAIKTELTAPLGPVATASPVLAVACDRLRRLASAEGELLIVGETGAGKEVYARAVHERSGRRGRFMAINCGAIPRDLVESELFGYRQGAHSTAHQAKPGLIEEAEGGTLFLDEIGEMTTEAQSKLLRFLQDRELTPLGATRPRRMDVRIIAATHRPTVADRGGSGVREDVLARLGAAPIQLPPLRDRIEDLGALIGHFLRNTPHPRFDPAAFRALTLYEWPLNVRELEKLVTTAAVLTAGERPIALRDLPDPIARAANQAASAPPRRVGGPSPTPAQIEELLERYNGNVADVSRELGKHRAAVWRWMKKWGIGVDKFRKQAGETGEAIEEDEGDGEPTS